MADAFSIKFDTSGLFEALDGISEAAEEHVRPAAQAGAQVLYDEVLLRVPVSSKGHWFHGTSFRKTGQKYWFDAGTLRRAIYQVFSKDNSGATRAAYHVSWNYTKAPYAAMVEYGTSNAPARPFLRPAFDAAAERAMQVVVAHFAFSMQPALKGQA